MHPYIATYMTWPDKNCEVFIDHIKSQVTLAKCMVVLQPKIIKVNFGKSSELYDLT